LPSTIYLRKQLSDMQKSFKENEREKSLLEITVEYLKEELKHKEQGLTEMNDRYNRLNLERNKSKEVQKKLEYQIMKLCNIQTKLLQKEEESVSDNGTPEATFKEQIQELRFLLHREQDFQVLKQRYSETLASLVEKIQGFHMHFDSAEEQLQRAQGEVSVLSTACDFLKTQLAANEIRHTVVTEALKEELEKEKQANEANRATISQLKKRLDMVE
jgi:chromosome segregation ATPase